MKRRNVSIPGLLAVALLCGCASTLPPDGQPDSWERVNRPFQSFNTGVDDYALGPVSHGWKFVSAQFMRDSLSNFFFNWKFPERFVSSLGQAEAGKVATEVGRFTVNTTIGLAGFFDVATPIGLSRYDEDLGQMFGRWGIPPGPYWVIPLYGPSNPRDATGDVLGTFLSPFVYFGPWVSGISGAVNLVNARAQADEEIENAKRTALDYYVFVRNAYVQRRDHQVRDLDEAPDSPHGDEYDYYYDYEDEPDATEFLDTPVP